MFLSKSKTAGNDRWLEWSEKMRVEAQIKREEFVKKQEEAGKLLSYVYQKLELRLSVNCEVVGVTTLFV